MSDEEKKPQNSRRSILKGLMGIPFAGGVLWGAYAESKKLSNQREKILKALNIDASAPDNSADLSGEPIRIGIVGFGIRGKQLLRALGFAHNEWVESMKNNNPGGLEAFLEQEKLNVRIAGICDVFDHNAQLVLDTFPDCKRYNTHEELFASPEIDAVVIAAPDHWHAPMAMKAMEAGKHVYVEKPMTHNVSETYALKETVERTGKVLQVGHQHRQTQSFITAQDIIRKKILGHVSLVEVNTNRNSDNGAWQYDIHEAASPQTIDWDQFIGNAPMVPFNKEHFFRWRKWWAYGSGLAGDLMTHDFDRINCVLQMGMPDSVMMSGGIYTHIDGRNVPDVIHVNMEYPEFSTGSSREGGLEKGMTFVYSASLGNQFTRPTLLMGHDGTMELGNRLTVYADGNSTRYREMIREGLVDPSVPLYSYDPSASETDGITSATSKYFADKGLLWTYRGGRRVDATHLHMKEWLNAIRNGTPVSCGIQEGFEEAMTAHMASISWKLGTRIYWDRSSGKIAEVPGVDLDEVLLGDKIYNAEGPESITRA